jgi:signal transduction histidine kinase
VALAGPRDELRELADTFDDMLGRLQAAFEGQRRFIANASHELRTPLTVMRATVDVVLAKPTPAPRELLGMGQGIRTAVDQAEALVNALLTLAQTEHRLAVREEFDLATIAEDVLDSIDSGDLRLYTSLQPAWSSCDRLLMGRVISNLLNNAVRYNVSGGNVRIATSTVDDQAIVEVTNTGPIIAPGMVDGLFEPFRRLHDRTSGDGFGLGLAIVASIAAAHDATVVAHQRPEGGLKVTVAMSPRAHRSQSEPPEPVAM